MSRMIWKKVYPGGRRPQLEHNVAFEEILPMRLKAQVSGKGNKSKDVACLFEMSVLMACLKENEFRQSPCATEISKFESCYSNHLTDKARLKNESTKGVLTPGEHKMGFKQLNQILKRYPPIDPPQKR